jgi:hypothetical protein
MHGASHVSGFTYHPSGDASQNDPALHARVQALFQLNLAHMLARDNDQPDIAAVPRHGRRVAGVLDCLADGGGGGRTVLVGEGQDDVAVLAGGSAAWCVWMYVCMHACMMYLVGALEGADEDAAVRGVDAQRLADELGEPEGGLFRVHGGGGRGWG